MFLSTSTIIAALLLASVSLRAQQTVVENGRTYKMHKVAKGEGFYRLSIDNGITQEDILSANPELKTTGLIEGVVIRIPVKAQKTTQSSPSYFGSYTVKTGDTSYSISKAHGMTLAEFFEKNKQVSEGGLKEGMTVTVRQEAQETGSTHIVRRGETAYSISKAYGISVVDFYRLNPQASMGVKEGDVLKVPIKTLSDYVYHIITMGETLYAIAVKYGVNVKQIIEANIAINPNALQTGTAIRIPMSQIPTEDDAFIYHRLSRGETLYALCNQYNLLQERIKEFNPNLDWNALSVGQIIAIPKAVKIQTSTSTREVQRRETLFSIAQEEGLLVEDIIGANEGLTADNLQKGMTIHIPHYSDINDVRPATLSSDYVGTIDDMGFWSDAYNYEKDGRPTIRVFLMLPFNAKNEMGMYRASGGSSQNSYIFKSRRYIEFYEGVHLALDRLTEKGANIELSVFDTNNRLEVINQLNTAQQKPDLIIGPAHRAEMTDVMSYAVDKRVPIVLPFGQCDSTIVDNPYIFQASTIDSISTKAVYDKMTTDMVSARVICIRPGGKNRADQYRMNTIRRMTKAKGVDLVEHNYEPSSTQAFIDTLSSSKLNIVILPSNNEAYVSSVVTSLASLTSQKNVPTFELWGTSDWLTFQAIDVEVFHALTTKIYSTFGIDEKDETARKVLNKYRRQYFTEPIAFTPNFQRLKNGSGFSEYGIWGYDIAMKFVGARVFRGPQFVRNVNAYTSEQIQSNFIFHNLTNWGGAVNIGLKTIVFNKNGEIDIQSIDN